MGKYSAALKSIGESFEYWTQVAMRRFVSDLTDRMERRDINRAELANRMGVSPAYISRVLKGDANFTLESMTKLALATGGKLDVRVVDEYRPRTASHADETLEVSTSRRVSAVNFREVSFTPANEAEFHSAYVVGQYPNLRLVTSQFR